MPSVDVDVCKDEDYIKGGGCGCGTSCPGEAEITNGCLNFRINLGQIGNGESAGYLLLFTHRPHDGLARADALQFFLNDRLEVTGTDVDDFGSFAHGDHKITPVSAADEDWGEATLNRDSDGFGYAIKFYESVNGTLATSPYRTVAVKNLNGATSNDELYITETIDLAGSTPRTRMWHFEWTGTTAGETDDGSWILKEGEAGGAAGLTGDTILRVTERAEDWNGAGDEVTETVTIKESGGTVVSKTEEVWHVYEWGRERISMTRDPDTTAADKQLKETWTYYDDAGNDGDNYGRKESYLSHTGYWERYEYDSDGNVAKTMRQFEDEALSLGTAFATAAASNIVEYYTEDDSVSITGYTNDVRVEKWQIKVEGTVERTWYRVYVDEVDSDVSGSTAEWMVRPVIADPENGTTLAAVIEDVLDGTDTTSLVTKSWHWVEGATGIGDNEPYDVRAMQASDGQYTIYERTVSSGQQTKVVKSGFSDDSLIDILVGTGGADIEYGTRTTSVVDARGNMVYTKLEMISESDNGGVWFITSFTRALSTDEFGRPTQTQYFFGEEAADEAASGAGTAAYTTQITYVCCGGGDEEIRIGRDGVKTATFEDVLGRTVYTKRWGDLTSINPLYSVSDYDAAGRVIASGLSTDDDLADASDLKSQSTYDKAGRMTSMTDPEGRMSYMTFRRVTTAGAVFSGTVGTDPFYWETRSYGNDDDVPVSVSWTDSHGNTVLSYTGSGTWTGVPTGSESLTEHTRSTSLYDWDNRVIEGRAYFYINSLAKDAAGTAGTNYLVTGTTEYDALGRGFRSIDAAGNITQTVYEDGTGRAIKTLIGVSTSDLHTVQRVYYNKFVSGAPTGDARPWPVRVYTVKPGLTSSPDDSDLDDASPTLTDYTYTERIEEYSVTSNYLTASKSWSRPEFGPWSCSETDDQGRGVASYMAKNGNASYLLSMSTTSYYPDSSTPDGSNGKTQYSDSFPVTSGSAGSDKIRSTYYYDDAGRPVKTESTGREFSKTAYDAYGRTARTVFGSSEGTNTDSELFTDDVILSESVPTYDKSGLTTGSVSYERAHDATATGLLSSAAADQSRASYSYNWYDTNGRSTHSATVGTDSSYSYVASTPPTPNSSDAVLVSKVEYDNAGRSYLSTDNLGRKTRVFYDDLGRVTHTVENWDGSLTTPDSPGSRAADVNRVTKNIYDNSATGGGARIEIVAIDPDANGTTTNNQSTLYIHSGEVNASERGPIPVNGRPIAVLMPDAIADGTTRASAITEINASGEVFGDFTFTAYYANGQVRQTTDPRGVQHNMNYTSEGWINYTTVSEAAGNTWVSVGDLRTAYTYGDAGETLTITSYSDTSGTTATSKLTYTYNGFYNVTEEKQDHNPTANSGAGDPKSILWAYDTAVASNLYTKAYRLDKVTYPNGRVLQLNYDGHSGIDDAISRANAIEEDATSADIVSYTYLGSGRMVRKDYPTPNVRLDFLDESGEGSNANDDYEVSLDAFGRPTRYQWETYDGSGDAEEDLIHIAHAYDRNSNRKYDQRKVATSYSKVYTRDELDRITEDQRGKIKSDFSAIEPNWVTGGAAYQLNQLGSIIGVNPSDETEGQIQTFTYNDANEPTAINYKGIQQKEPLFFDNFEASATYSNWELPSGSSDTYAIDSGGNGELTFSLSQDTYDGVQEPEACAILLWKDSTDFGKVEFDGNMFPTTTSGKQVGFVFGYKSPNDYYIAVAERSNKGYVYHIHKANPSDTTATKTLVNWVWGFKGNARFSPNSLRAVFEGNEIPEGRIGIWTNDSSATIKDAIAYADAKAPNWLGRWQYSEAATSYNTYGSLINTQWDFLLMSNQGTLAKDNHNEFALARIDGMTAKRFQITFSAKYKSNYSAPTLRFAYNGDDDFHQVGVNGQYKTIYLDHVTNDNATDLSPSTYPANFPTITADDKVWFRYESDGSTLIGYALKQGTAPTEIEWGGTSAFVTYGSLPDVGLGGIGLGTNSVGQVDFDDLTLKSDTDDNGSYETVELYDSFTADASSFRDAQPEHDPAGNLTFDGNRFYTYDAYNRLVMVQHAFKDAGYNSGALTVGSTVAEYQYDPAGRRITKDTYVGGELNSVEHYYYTGQSQIETRNGSDQVTQQHVWDNLAPGSGHYIDSLAQVANNADPGDATEGTGSQELCEDTYYPMQDQQFNVLALTDDAGDIVERYEYSLYGQRTVMNATYVVLYRSAYDMAMGFQGLMHDTETGLVYNRARMLDPITGRFIQRDPLGYPDGLNTYAAYHVMWGGVDPLGLWKIDRKTTDQRATATSEAGDTIEKLAAMINLDADEWRNWTDPKHFKDGEVICLKDGRKIPWYKWKELQATDIICPDEEFLIPNLVQIDMGDSVTNWFMTHPIAGIFSRFEKSSKKVKENHENAGYSVSTIVGASDQRIVNHLVGQTKAKTLYRYYFYGHGDGLGVINVPDGAGNKIAGVPAGKYTHYGLSRMALYACGSTNPAGGRLDYSDVNGNNQYIRPLQSGNTKWRFNVSTSGKLYGYEKFSVRKFDFDNIQNYPGLNEIPGSFDENIDPDDVQNR